MKLYQLVALLITLSALFSYINYRFLRLPTTIARLCVPYGDNGGWPWYHLLMMKNGVPIPVHTDGPSQYTLLHQRETAEVRDQPPVELLFNWEPDV